MALRLTIIFLFCIPIFLFSQQDLELIGTDAYETNYFTSKNETLQHRLFIGNDMFRFLDGKQLDTALNLILDYLEKDSLIDSRNYNRINDFTISIPIKIAKIENLSQIASSWESDYSITYTDLIYDLCAHLLTDSMVAYKNSVEPVFHQFFRNEYRNKYSDFSKTSKNGFAIVLKDSSELKIRNQRSFFKRKYSLKKLTYSEIALVNNNEKDIVMSMPIVSKMSKPNNYFALNIIEQKLNENLEIIYGVNQSILLINHPEKNNLENILLNIDANDFKQNSRNIISNLREEINEENLFFFTKDDFEILKTMKDTFSFTNYQDFVSRLNESNKILIINQDSIQFEQLSLSRAGLDVFSKNIQMKSNSVEFKNPEDKKLIHQIFLLMTLNSDLNININGYALEKEYSRVSRSEIKEIINKEKDLNTNFKLSKNTSLALMRSVTIFQALVDLGIHKERMRCNGFISNNESQSIKISIQN